MTLLGTYYTYFQGTGSNTPLTATLTTVDWRFYYKVYLDYQDNSQNKSYLYAEEYIDFRSSIGSGSYYEYFETGSQWDDGSWSSHGQYINFNAASTQTIIKSGTTNFTKTHNSDGTASVDYQGRGYGNGKSYYYISQKTLTLPTIPRASSITSPSANFSYTIGNTLAVTVDKKSTSFTDNLVFKVAGTTVATRSDFTSSTVTFTSGEIDAMYNALPSSNSGTMIIELTTKDGTTTIGTDSESGTAYVTNSNPIFTNFATEDIGAISITITGDNQKYIEGYNTLEFTISTANKATAQNGATMVSYIVKCGSKQTTLTYSAVADVVGSLSNVIDSSAQVYAVDSRGNQTLVSKTITIIPYDSAIINSASGTRTSGIGEEVTLVAAGTWTSGNLGATTNSLTATYEYKQTSSDTWLTGSSSITVTPSGDTFSINQIILGDTATGFDSTKSFDVKVTISDVIDAFDYDYTFEIPKGTPILHIDPEGVGVNKTHENGALDVGGDIYTTGKVNLNGNEIENIGSALKFNGVSSKAVSGTFASFNVGTLYFKLTTGSMSEASAFLASFNNASNYTLFKSGSTGDKFRITTNGNTYGSTIVQPNTLYDVVFRWNGTTYDIFVNGSKETLGGSGATTQLALTKLALGYWESSAGDYTQQIDFDVRIDSSAISEADALALTGGTKTADEVLPSGSTELVYNNFNSATTITNNGTLSGANLTGTDLELVENITNFENLAEKGLLLEDKYLKKSYIQMYLNAHSVSNDNRELSLAEFDKNGNKFSVSSGRVLIGEGVNKVKVSYVVTWRYDASASNDMVVYIRKNSTNLYLSVIGKYGGSTHNINVGSAFVNVSEGDTLSLYVTSTGTIKNIYGNSTSPTTYMTVEEM